ncbi:uncharacterized protein ARMOST_04168 [Armillaria ostoyae]|uniref:Uncharacterized protein n=1 Tax=Armillaria ostoyae TaxID=47428 RepID=A0A284QWM4_ARMOS|nr:uncharacterized protein ARMOST_04168 [Armillaria ostoyae]
MPVLWIDHILSNFPAIFNPLHLGRPQVFSRIVQEYQLARCGLVLFQPLEAPPIDDSPPDEFLIKCGFMPESYVAARDDLDSESSNSDQVYSSLPDSEDAPPRTTASSERKMESQGIPQRDNEETRRVCQTASG